MRLIRHAALLIVCILLRAPAHLNAQTFTTTGSLNTARVNNTATLLNNGSVLVSGGDNAGSQLSSAELYNLNYA